MSSISTQDRLQDLQRYIDLGLDGLTDRSRRPFRQANKLPMQIETLIVQLKREHPSRGAPKIREKAFSSIAIALVAARRRVRMLQLMPIDDRRSG